MAVTTADTHVKLPTQQGIIFIHDIQEITCSPESFYIVSANMRHLTPFSLDAAPATTSLTTLQITQPHVKQQISLLINALAHFTLVQAEITVKNLVVLSNHDNYMPYSAGELVAVHHFMAQNPLFLGSS